MDSKKERFNKPESYETKYYRTYEDSPVFRITPVTLTANTYRDYNLDSEIPASKKFLPLTNLQVINNSSVAIYIFINGSANAFVCPAGTQIVFDRNAIGGGVNYLRVQNGSASVTMTSGEVDINLWKEGIVIDEAFKQMHKAFYKFLFRR